MTDELKLDAIEARVLGVLIEKSLTTPEQYPLSLNGATLGCNQKSNRDPVLELMEGAGSRSSGTTPKPSSRSRRRKRLCSRSS
jgi:uncharacterized protein YceH (UPF0502 family)